MWISGACWASVCVLGAVLPTQSSVLPSPTPHFQGDSSFVIMTNFIATPHQAQGYCAEVRTAIHSLSLLLTGENIMEEEIALGTEDRISQGKAMVEF